MTTIQDTLTYADGRLANGQIVVSWPAWQSNGTPIAGGMQTFPVVNGAVDIDLYSNVNARPTGMYYTATYELDEGAVYTEWWILPNLPMVKLGQVKVAFPTAPSAMISALQLTSAGATYGQFLGWNGSHWIPMYTTTINISPNTIGLVLTAAAASDLSISGSPAALGANLTLNVPDAGSSSRGVVTTGAQTFAGNKTFSGSVTFLGSVTIPVGSVIGGYVQTSRKISTGYGLSGGGDLTSDRTLQAVDNATVQKVEVLKLGALVGTRHAVNLIAGTGIALTVADNAGQDWVDVTVTSTGAAAPVTSVFGRTGDVVAGAGPPYDYTAAQVQYAVSTQGSYSDPSWISSLSWGKITGAPTVVPTSRQVLAGPGLTGGGTLAADVTLSAPVMKPSGASHAAGIAPDPGATAGATRYLREDAIWAVPLGGGGGGGLADPTTTLGDLLVRDVSAVNRFGIGTTGQVLTVDTTQPLLVKWAVVSASQVTNAVSTQGSYPDPSWITSLSWSKITGVPASVTSPLTSKGDIHAFSTVDTRLPVGANALVLTADSTQVTGLRWAAVPVQLMGASGASHAAGAAPDPGATAGSTRFLREDATWAAPPAPPAAPVTSVFTRTGAVVAASGDYTFAQIAGLTAKGDLVVRDSSGPVRLPVSATDGWILAADSTQTAGIKWAAPPAAGQNQTPWLSNIDGAGYQLSNASKIIIKEKDGYNLVLDTTASGDQSDILFRSAGVYAGEINCYAGQFTIYSSSNVLSINIAPNGRVGIANSSPGYMLDVGGDVNVEAGFTYRINGVPISTSPAGASGNLQWNNGAVFGASAALTWDNTNSRLGVGTNVVPTQTLDVWGPTYGSPAISGSAQNGSMRVAATGHGEILDVGILGGGVWLQARNNGNYTANYNICLNPNGGNVSIGAQTAPSAQLHMLGAGQAVLGISTTTGLGGTIIVQDSGGGVNNGGAIIFGAQQGCFAAIKSLIQNGGGNTQGALSVQVRVGQSDTALTSIMYIDSTGRVAIGASRTPGYTLDVGGDVNCTGSFRVNGTAISTGGQPQTPWAQPINANGQYLTGLAYIYVGSAFTVYANVFSGMNAWFNNQYNSTNCTFRLGFGYYAGLNNSNNAPYIQAYGTAGSGALDFGSAGVVRMTIDESGNIQINRTPGDNQGMRLNVNGPFNASSIYQNGTPHLMMRDEVAIAPRGADPGPDHRGLWVDHEGYLRYRF